MKTLTLNCQIEARRRLSEFWRKVCLLLPNLSNKRQNIFFNLSLDCQNEVKTLCVVLLIDEVNPTCILLFRKCQIEARIYCAVCDCQKFCLKAFLRILLCQISIDKILKAKNCQIYTKMRSNEGIKLQRASRCLWIVK